MIQTVTSESAQSIAQRAETLRLSGNYESAIILFQQAIDLDPNYAWAYAHLGVALRENGDLVDSQQTLLKAIDLNNEYDWAYANLGYTNLKAQRYLDAQKNFEQAITINDKYAWAYAHLAEVIYALGGSTESVKILTQVLKVSSDESSEEFNVDEISKKGFEKALDLLNQAIDLVPQYSYAFGLRAGVFAQLGEIAESQQQYKESTEYYRNSGLDILTAIRYDNQIFDNSDDITRFLIRKGITVN